ncbi:MAG: STAS domain-containing protein, partial [Hydrogenophaga sp.]
CDSSAVAVLLELRRELQQQGKALRLHNGPQRLRDLVALYGVQELLTV